MTRSYIIAALSLSTVLLSPTTLAQTAPSQQAVATFAGGCFWCMEPPFDALDGVISTTSGYIGGHKENPTYQEVSAGKTGHTEAVQVVYNPSKVSYRKLLEVYWVNIDPFAVNAQFCDKGSQYRAEIFTHNAEQQRLAEASKQKVSTELKAKLSTIISPATTFYPAEHYHQDYYMNNPIRYTFYRQSCGRDKRLKVVWGDKYSKD
ncbi:peptide-methionine (S)-S-oxide reductase [Oceanospirillum multiglobuliferum]|uniref:Peptide methionine sulfoxide reductase MsrA n=1 Tax=Oceanospirillum multiglobuliferum TaxID=64969 RepID=A0A1T4PT26_9GAMM|nr:peptide-methionine (S)-S-oxide reductase MsrA [Oceanospirillum multiglobuliferum]OPX55359.1 peptide-methionine (S)-S-oxide reductase [Oceanospirillum multiglobuliferum]SJZ94038.1 peptide-methionine (S)-S-oxide reductase [Oceanospirillum multiglobuliferum]